MVDQDEQRLRVEAGATLTDGELEDLSKSHDIVSIGALADAMRRRIHGARATYLRVASCPWNQPNMDGIPPGAGELRLLGAPTSLGEAVGAVRLAKAAAGTRVVSGFGLEDVALMSGGGGVTDALGELRGAGLEMLAEVALDEGPGDEALEALHEAGFQHIRLTIDRVPAPQRLSLFARARALKERFPAIRALNPLPMKLNAFRPTTGYDDTKSVALARLAAPNIPTIQIDWQRYGPKLAQVALTFGADDLDGVSPIDDVAEGTRRTARAEVIRNIEAAGLTPAERDARFLIR